MKRTRRWKYGSHVSLTSRIHHGKKKWMVRYRKDGKDTQRLFRSYEDAHKAYEILKVQSLHDFLPRNLNEKNWHDHVNESEYEAILLWREFRNIYDEVGPNSSLPLRETVILALKTLQDEIEQGGCYGRKNSDGTWDYTETDRQRLERLDKMTNLFSVRGFLANKKEQTNIDFKRKFETFAGRFQKAVNKKLELNVIKKAHHDNVLRELKKWLLGWEEYSINEITPNMIEEKLSSFKYRDKALSNASKRRYRSTLHEFFVWAERQDMIAYNPVDKTIAPKAGAVSIGIISPGDLKKLLQVAVEKDKGMLFRLVLAAFCGLRRSECVRVTPAAVLHEKKEVFVSGTISKTGKQRFVPLPEAASDWLELAEFELLPDNADWKYYEGQHGVRLKKLAKQAGIVLPKNALRHSFASYAAAKTHDIPRVSMWLGHAGTNMTEKHYREGVRSAEGEEWFNIVPNTP